MAKFIRNFMLALACMSMAAPAAMADRHEGHRNARPTNTASQARPNANRGGNSGRPGLGNNGNNGNHNGNNNRPGGNNNRPSGNNNRPGGNNNGNNHRPNTGGGNHNGNVKPGRPNPGNHNNWNHGPATPPPQPPYRPGGHPVGRPSAGRPISRPFMRPMARPVPPPSWRARPGLPVIGGILGLNFGSALNVSLSFLRGNGYTVNGYANDVVYLRNVPVLNYIWTDGALYYGTSGLDASSFYYTTAVRDVTRYNSCYNVLVNTYGSPVSVVREGGGVVSTWFGGNNGYITLSFGSGQGGGFLTTLTYGL